MNCAQPISEMDMIQRLQNNLIQVSSTQSNGSESRAAVLMPLFCKESEWHLLFIHRAEHRGDRHSGQVAFPGGRWEAGDESLSFTALREAQEEIGLDPSEVNIIGRVEDINTSTGFLVAPYVGIIRWPNELRIDIKEVSRVFSIPLVWLADLTHREIRDFLPADGRVLRRQVILYQPYDGEILWGASARMVEDLLQRLQLINS